MRSRSAGRAASAVLEQGLNGFTNVALVALLARDNTESDVGRFAILILVIQAGLLLQRSLAGGVVLASERSSGDLRGAVSVALGCGVITSVSVGVAAVLVGVDRGAMVWAVAGLIVIVQDYFRHVLFSTGNFARAARAAVAWIVSMTAVYLAWRGSGLRADLAAVIAWAAGAACSLAVSALWEDLGRSIPSVTAARAFWRSHSSLVGTMLVEHVVGNSVALVGLGIVAVVLPFADLGQIRVAQAAVGPAAVASQAAFSVVASNSVRLDPSHHSGRLGRLVWAANLGVFVFSLTWAVALLLPPMSAGRAVFGPSWDGARPLCVIMAVQSAVSGLSVGTIAAGVRHADGSLVRRRRVLVSALFLVLQTAGAVVGEATGFAVAGVLAAVIGLGVWTRFGADQLDLRVRDPRPHRRGR